jgi:hypothetical protein
MPGVPSYYPEDPPGFQPPDVLYHYTTVEGIRGLVESGEAWATEIHFLNDAEELHHAVEQFRQRLRVLSEQSDDTERSSLLTLWSEAVRVFRDAQVFVFCLSERSDQLSQWRAYGSGEGGFAIGFNSQKLKKMSEQQSFRLEYCEYTEDPDCRSDGLLKVLEDRIDSRIWAAVQKFHAEKESDLSAARRAANELLAVGLSEFAPRIKHHAFREEKEWRLFSAPETVQQIERLGTRDGAIAPIPYYRFNLGLDLELEPTIERIVIGPSRDQHLAALGVEKLFDTVGIQRPAIVMSAVPFRDV